MNIGIITNGLLPVPNIKGGGVETLIQYLIDENEIQKKHRFIVYSIYNEDSVKVSKKYKYTDFVFLQKITEHSPKEVLTNYINWKLLKIPSYKNHFSINDIINDMKKRSIDKLIFENNYLPIRKISKNFLGDIYWHPHNQLINLYGKDSIFYTNKIFKITSKCKSVITISEYMRKELSNIGKINPQKIKVLKNCTDLSFQKIDYDTQLIKQNFNIADDELVITYIGRIVPEKGVLELIQAFKSIQSKKKLKLFIVGNLEDNKEYTERLLNTTKNYKNIIYTGYIQNEKLHYIRAISDIAVVPSLCIEAAGLVVIEALASGVPVIATNSGGIPEYMDENCGIIIENNEYIVKNITISLEKLINDDKLRNKMGDNAKKFATKFDSRNYYKNLCEIIS